MSSPTQAGSSAINSSRRKGKGRKKVSMIKIQNESKLQVTFSKRRTGLFKKASELFTLCGVEGAIIVFSPGTKVYSFAHPDLETIKARLLNGVLPSQNGGKSINQIIFDAQRDYNIKKLNIEVMELEAMVYTGKRRREELNGIKKEGQKHNWFPPPIEEFNREGLVALNQTVKNVKEDLDKHVAKVSMLVNQYEYGRGGGMNIENVYQAPNDPNLTMAFNNNNNINAIASYELFRRNETHIPITPNDCNDNLHRLMSGGSRSGMHIPGDSVSASAASMFPNDPQNDFIAGEFYRSNDHNANF